jgi:integrase/recombinase XerC
MRAIIEAWLKDLRNSRGFSENTVKSYSCDINLFIDFLKKYKTEEFSMTDVMHATKQEVRAWFLYRRNNGDTESSIARSLSALKSCLRYCVETGAIHDSPVIMMHSARVGKSLPRPISGSKINDIIESVCVLKTRSWIIARDKALLALIYSVGLRISEALNIKRADIVGSAGSINILGKGGKNRTVPLLPEIRSILEEYISYPDTPCSEFLFVNGNGNRLSASSVQKLVQRARRLLGLPETLTPHSLRHSCATHIMESSEDIRGIQEILGHSSISSTQIYADIAKRQISNAYDKYHPLSIKSASRKKEV